MNLHLTGLTLPATLMPAAPLTDEELMRFSEENKPLRIERNKEGELVIMTPVGGIGSAAELYVSRMLGNWADDVPGGIAFSPNGGFNLPDGSCLSPDASWIAIERWNALTPAQQKSFPPLCPDFIIEVRSQSDSRRVLEAKMQSWLDNGALLAWLIDPIDNTVTIYRPSELTETLERPDVLNGHPPVATFQLRTTRLWS